MQNISVRLIRRNLETLAFLIWYRSNEFPVIRLRAHQAVKQDDHLFCKVTFGVQLDHGASLGLVDNVH